MIYIGQKNRLRVIKRVDFGLYLDGEELGELLLPDRYIPEGTSPGDFVHVFIYADSDDKLICTTEEPLVMVGESAYLKVKEQNDFGTFMDWGLSKDLLVPFNEQAYPMSPGRSYVVYAYLDSQTNRIAASTKLHHFLNEDGRDYKLGEQVDLMIAAQTELGYKAIINGTHLGLIFKSEVFQPLKFGQQMQGYIRNIRSDGKVDLSLQQAAAEVRDKLEGEILDYLNAHEGVSTLTDKSPPDLIYRTFKVSKANFKRALGRLYKKRLVKLEKERVTLLKP